MTWRAPVARLALLELLVRGSLKCRRAQAPAWDLLAELPWTKRTGRRDELALVERGRGELVALLTRVWPGWSEALAELTARGLPPTPEGWTALEDARRAESLPAVPGRLNRRTAAALAAPSSKATLTDRRLAALGDIAATHDGSIRIRPPANLVARTPRGTVDLSAIAAILGEVSLPERAFDEGLSLEGEVRATLLVENLGAFCDLPAIDGWLYVHVAGWDTATVGLLLDRLEHAPVIHFGDLDPNGVRIHYHLRGRFPGLRWFIPGFWAEWIESKGQRCAWPSDLDIGDAPALVRELAARGVWLEQEPVAVDSRTPAALEGMFREHPAMTP
jgi:Wadjet anti plasmid transformation system JetA-like protein